MKYNHWLPKLINANAIVINKTIYYALPKEQVSDRLIKHEQEHVKQQEQDGLFFYVRYLKEYLTNLIKYRSHQKAYWYISYEVEARKAEEN